MKRIIYIIMTAILIATAFVGLKYYAFSRIMSTANWGMRAICNTNDVSDLYLGSSVFRQGIDTKGLGKHTFLLAYNSNKPFHEAMQLKYMLGKGAKFDRLIVDMYPYSITRDVGISDVRMIMDGDMRFTYDVYMAMHEQGYSIFTLYDLFVLQNNEFFLTLPISYGLMNSRYLRGSNMTMRHGKTIRALLRYKPKKIESVELNESQIAGLNQIINLCRERKINLVFLETPKFCKINNDVIYNKLMKEFAVFLSKSGCKMILYDKTRRKLAGIVNNSLVQSYEFNDSNARYFTDLYHISYEGRQVLTKELNELLDRHQ